MDTAYLRIKFTPLLKECAKHNSKCFLQIVPEVTQIQNFDKLTWKKESNYIEYTVPMTYKIILKKQNRASEKDNETIRTYYSCVDLLLSTSQSKYDLASGDVSRIISDTFILSKIPPNNLKKDYFIGKFLDDINNVTQSGTATGTLDVKDCSIKETEEKVENKGLTKSKSQQFSTENVEVLVCDKQTNTETVPALHPYCLDLDINAKGKTKPESKRILSVSPMMSFKLQVPSQVLSRQTMSKAITCNIHNSSTDMAEAKNIKSNNTNEIKLSKMVSKLGDMSKSTIKNLFFTCNNPPSKYPPETRIAQYVQYMETELLPLNLFLEKLINKCSILGLNVNQCRSTKDVNNNMLLYKSVDMRKIQEKENVTTETCEKVISNRAVFSILYND